MSSLAKARKTWEPIFLITDQPISCTIFFVWTSIFSLIGFPKEVELSFFIVVASIVWIAFFVENYFISKDATPSQSTHTTKLI